MEHGAVERSGVVGVLFLRRRIALFSAESQGCPRDHHVSIFPKLHNL